MMWHTLRNASTDAEECKHTCWEMQTQAFLYVKWNVEHIKRHESISVFVIVGINVKYMQQ